MRIYLDNCCYNRSYDDQSQLKFDYTKWRQSFVDSVETFDDLDRLLSETKERSRYGGRAETMI